MDLDPTKRPSAEEAIKSERWKIIWWVVSIRACQYYIVFVVHMYVWHQHVQI